MQASLSHASGQLILRTEGSGVAHVDIFSASGQHHATLSINYLDGYGTTSLPPLPAGVYLARARMATGSAVTKKFVVK